MVFVTVRLLDPPLHEFLPKSEKEIFEVAKVVGTDVKRLSQELMNSMNKTQCLAIEVVD